MKDLKVKLHNRFDVFKRDVHTGEEKQIAYAENIILNNLWAKFNSSTNYWGAHVAIGTGTGTLDPARTTLFNWLAYFSTPSNVYTYIPEDRAWSRRVSFTISEAQYVGAFITEIGMVAYNTTTNITTHALFKDMNGNPVAIEKTDTDIITFYATVYAVFDEEWFDSGAVHLVDFSNSRSAFVNACLGTAHIGSAAGSFYYNSMNDSYDNHGGGTYSTAVYRMATTGVTLAWDSSLKKITLTAARVSAGSGNGAAGFWSALWTGGKINFNIIKSFAWGGSYIEGELIGTGDGSTVDFRTAYPELSGAPVIKVDGVVENDVTIDYNTLYDDDLNRYTKILHATDPRGLPGTIKNQAVSSGGGPYETIIENPLYETYGISHMYAYQTRVSASNDLENWDVVLAYSNSTSDQAIPLAYQGYRYWKGDQMTNEAAWCIRNSTLVTAAALKNIHFTNPPAVGAQITADYTTGIVAKDVNHVFDFTAEIYLAEYVPD